MVYVSLLIHHGGTLRDGDGSFEYESGEVHYWEDIDIDMITYLDIEEELKKLGYGNYSDSDVLEMDKWDDSGDIYLYVKALERQDSEDDSVLGDNENNVEKGTFVDPAEKCPMADDENNEDSNYDLMQITSFDDMVNEDIPSNLTLPSELDSDDLSHTPALSDKDDFEEHMREKRGDILSYKAMLIKNDRKGRFELCDDTNQAPMKPVFKRFYVGFSALRNDFWQDVDILWDLTGLLNAIYPLAPRAEHKNCARHV
ncbi:hypothetical protein GH714_041412 [Hevea brasiliensis]|uniref:PB1-like domain-containing protein n=1 Tax=Hevea brasiliensis TaxID=3981 RepID=A0A6A6N0V5_HEVBR|nr:hypothetical protein GH714_041412 [Hevea brasiliensis]